MFGVELFHFSLHANIVRKNERNIFLNKSSYMSHNVWQYNGEYVRCGGTLSSTHIQPPNDTHTEHRHGWMNISTSILSMSNTLNSFNIMTTYAHWQPLEYCAQTSPIYQLTL